MWDTGSDQLPIRGQNVVFVCCSIHWSEYLSEEKNTYGDGAHAVHEDLWWFYEKQEQRARIENDVSSQKNKGEKFKKVLMDR